VNYRPLRLGTRRSPMAIAQSRQVAGMITTRTGTPVEIAGVTTLGDVSRSQLAQLGGTGVFVSALREALLAGEVDLAVHSAEDLPAGAAAGIVLAAVPTRDDPRDALVAQAGAKLADLPAGARTGTGSPRRAAQLLRLRGDLRCVPIRGNADTRLGKVGEGELEGVVLGHAGLTRLAASTPSRRCSSWTRCCRLLARGRWRWSAVMVSPGWRRCSERFAIWPAWPR
jgi:hydroxymethylbilane synthase